MRTRRMRLTSGRDPPHAVPCIVGDQQSSRAVHGHPHRAAVRLAVACQKAVRKSCALPRAGRWQTGQIRPCSR